MKRQIASVTAALGTVAIGCFSASHAFGCDRETPCTVYGGDYHIALPESVPQSGSPIPAVVFIHGFGSSGQNVLRNTGMIDPMLARGYAVIAPNGMAMQHRNGRSWSFMPNRPKLRDEVAFLTSVRDDIIAKHNIDPQRVLLSGFSIGGSMTSYVACEKPDAFSAYAPLAGSFWRPHPDGCNGNVQLFHTHGWRDGTVPLEGRVLRGADIRDVGSLAQGDVFRAMEIWRETNDCVHLKADSFKTEGQYWIRKWERCLPGSALEFAIFDGGHVIPKGWADMALNWFEGLQKES
ncbi:MAG: alpha/beta fold hydrolase [Pseudomonadota bacterium]